MAYGATDDFGFKAAQDVVHVHDLHATILHLMGLDHEKLTFRHAGRDYRLTDVHGEVVKKIHPTLTSVIVQIMLVLFLLFLFGIFEYCRFILALHAVTNACRDGARYAVVNSNKPDTFDDVDTAASEVTTEEWVAKSDAPEAGSEVAVTAWTGPGTDTWDMLPWDPQRSGAPEIVTLNTPEDEAGRVSGVFKLMGQATEKRGAASAGETVALGKLDHAKTGETLGSGKQGPAQIAKIDPHPPVLAIADLGVVWDHRRGPVPILGCVSLSIAPGFVLSPRSSSSRATRARATNRRSPRRGSRRSSSTSSDSSPGT